MANYKNKEIDQETGIVSVELDDILFNNIDLANGYKEISQHKIAPINSFFNPSGDGNNKDLILNAVDIDWNGAQIPSTTQNTPLTINTTGQLISAIKWASLQGKGVVDGDTQYKLN